MNVGKRWFLVLGFILLIAPVVTGLGLVFRANWGFIISTSLDTWIQATLIGLLLFGVIGAWLALVRWLLNGGEW